MNDILKALFLDNPYIPEHIYTFCKQLPEFQAAKLAYEEAVDKLRLRLGAEEVNTFEEILTQYLARYVHAYYLLAFTCVKRYFLL